jgi:hypothetical protein
LKKANKNFYMSNLNLRNENKTSDSIAKNQEHLTILSLECSSQIIKANLSDGRAVTLPTAWFKRLRQATPEQLNNYEISPVGCAIHWEELDEDISIKSFLNGLRGGCCH